MASWHSDSNARYSPLPGRTLSHFSVFRHIGTIRLSLLSAILIGLIAWHNAQPTGQATYSRSEVYGYARIIDGDTIDVAGIRIRLHGIDAPEIRQTCTAGGQKYRCGEQATTALAGLIGANAVRCDPLGT